MRSWALPALLLVGVGQPGAHLTRYESRVGGFSVLLPAEPVEAKLAEPDRYRVLLDGFDGAYLVFHEPRPDLATAPEDEQRRALMRVARSLEAMVEGRLLDDSVRDVEGEPPGMAFDIEMTEPPGLFRSRLYVAGERLIRLTAVGDLEFALSENAEGFLASFRVIRPAD